MTGYVFSQADCSNAQNINLQIDGTVTVSSNGVSGTAPTTVCSLAYDETDITAGEWYEFTPSQDLVVNISKDLPTADTDYYSTFNVFSGSCNDLICETSAFYGTADNGNSVPAEAMFAVDANTTITWSLMTPIIKL